MFNSQKKEPPKTSIGKIIAGEFSAALKLLLFLIILFLASHVSAQGYNPCKSAYMPDSVGGPGAVKRNFRVPVPYPFVREADVMWSKRIWRTLDLREKLNMPYYYPEVPHDGRVSLFDLIKGAVLNGCVTAFDNPAMDDEFKVKMTPEAVADLLIQKDVVDVEDPFNPGTFKRDTIITETTSADILAYWIKEDWFFDKQRSVMDVRIIGLCPLATKKDPSTGEVVGYKPLFWLYFPQLRPLLVRQEVYIGQNNSQKITFDDMFEKRYFSSYIHKESNVYDRPVNSYATGIDALLESEDIKEDISNFESDLWHY